MLVLAAPVGNVFSLRSFKLLYSGGRRKFTGLTQECNPGFLLLRTSLKEGEAGNMPSAAVSVQLCSPWVSKESVYNVEQCISCTYRRN